MIANESFSDSLYADQTHIAERELSAFIKAVTQLFGSEEAGISVRDWLDESELMDSPPLSTTRDWRAITVAASARLAVRLEAARQQSGNSRPADAKVVESIPSSNSFVLKLVV